MNMLPLKNLIKGWMMTFLGFPDDTEKLLKEIKDNKKKVLPSGKFPLQLVFADVHASLEFETKEEKMAFVAAYRLYVEGVEPSKYLKSLQKSKIDVRPNNQKYLH